MNKIIELKEAIKGLSKEQKELRPQRKSSFEGTRTHRKPHPWETPWQTAYEEMKHNSVRLRHLHIAYCLLRGTPMEKIEPKNSQFKPLPDMSEVNSIMEEYRNGEETLRARAG